MTSFGEHISKYHKTYNLYQAALLLCDVEEEKLQGAISRITYLGGKVNGHFDYPEFKTIFDTLNRAIEDDQIQLGTTGKYLSDKHVPQDYWTIRRQDIKEWVLKSGTPKLPVSLFDETERKAQLAVSTKSFEILHQRLESEKKARQKAEQERDGALACLKDQEKHSKTLGFRAERTYLNIIGAFLEIVTGNFKDKSFSSETQLRDFISEKFEGFHGVSARTLADKFALAKKAINGEMD